MDEKIEDWIEQHAELLERLSEIEPTVQFGTIIIRKDKGRIAGLDTCQITRVEFASGREHSERGNIRPWR